jgi:hypothetical protein
MEQKSLHFSGPFGFSNSRKSLFHSEFVNEEGIYLWVIKDESNDINYIHYVGETTKFAKRQREHITHMVGLNYYMIDAKQAKQGIHHVVWSGMWRDKSNYAVQNMLENYRNASNHVIEYIESIDVYFAQTNCSRQIRRHIEGCIGWNLRSNHPDLRRFYPDDNHIGTMKNRIGKIIVITANEPIAGLDSEIEI